MKKLPICTVQTIYYCKITKYLDTPKIAVIILKFELSWLNRRVLHSKHADGMADSVNPHQTATLEQSDLGYTLPKPVYPQNLGTFGI